MENPASDELLNLAKPEIKRMRRGMHILAYGSTAPFGGNVQKCVEPKEFGESENRSETHLFPIG